MELPPISAAGLPGTAAAIMRGQQRFDDSAAAVTAAAEAQADEEPVSGEELTRNIVNMQADAISNQILYGVFRRQQEQQGDLIDLLKPR